MKSKALLFSLLFSWIGVFAQSNHHYHQWSDRYGHDEPGEVQYIQVALLLDVSGSMDGLLDQAKSQLWHIVNGLVWQLDGDYPPRIEIALYEFGNERLGSHRRYMRNVVPFTEDLDWISEALFQLRTGGRREYCGAVIEQATHELLWDLHPETIKLLYIAGNESFNQGPVSARSAIGFAREHGIQVNTIFCGSYSGGVKYGWKDAAYRSGGTFSTIDMNLDRPRHINTWDREVILLNTQLNQTYIPYGPQGHVYYQRQLAQDRNIENCGTVYFSQRIYTKASPVYVNSNWDLIDAVTIGKVNLATIPNHHLPREMRSMSLQQKERYIQQKRMERNRLKNRIQASRAPRTPRTPAPSVQQTPSQQARGRTLDQAILQSVEQSPRTPRTPSRAQRPQASTRPQRPSRSSVQTGRQSSGTVSHQPPSRTQGSQRQASSVRSNRTRGRIAQPANSVSEREVGFEKKSSRSGSRTANRVQSSRRSKSLSETTPARSISTRSPIEQEKQETRSESLQAKKVEPRTSATSDRSNIRTANPQGKSPGSSFARTPARSVQRR